MCVGPSRPLVCEPGLVFALKGLGLEHGDSGAGPAGLLCGSGHWAEEVLAELDCRPGGATGATPHISRP